MSNESLSLVLLKSNAIRYTQHTTILTVTITKKKKEKGKDKRWTELEEIEQKDRE